MDPYEYRLRELLTLSTKYSPLHSRYRSHAQAHTRACTHPYAHANSNAQTQPHTHPRAHTQTHAHAHAHTHAHSQLLESLEKARSDQDPLGPVFVKLAPFFRLYSTYYEQFSRAQDQIVCLRHEKWCATESYTCLNYTRISQPVTCTY